MKKRYYVKEMSDLTGVTPRTLRYYDSINLFKPSGVDENKYRFYHIEKFEEIDFIKFLRYLSIPILEIKEFMTLKNKNKFESMLVKHYRETLNKINELNMIAKKFERRIEDIRQINDISSFNQVVIKNLKQRKIKKIIYPNLTKHDFNTNIDLMKLWENKDENISYGNIGIIMNKDNFSVERFDSYIAVVMFVEDEFSENDEIKIIPHGEYACVYFKGDNSKSPKYYKMLYEYLEDNGLRAKGNLVERTVINNYISDDSSEYITEIQVPVIKK
jgi:DNA-binding transcriptional MerR regulator/DNA gyrase inhibitor GyrI